MAGMVVGARRPWLGPAGWAVAAFATAVLALLAARADVAAGGIGPTATGADIGIGLALVGGAALAPVSWRSRSLFAAVGLAWLLGSFVPGAELVYLAMLAIAITTFPGGRLRNPRDWVLVVLSLLAAVVALPVPFLATLFGAVAATAGIGRRWERAAVWAPSVAASAVAIVLAASWLEESLQPQRYDPGIWLLAIETVLLVIAASLPIAGWAVTRERGLLADRLLGDERSAGLDGLAVLLAETLADPRLQIHRWDADSGRFLGQDGSPVDLDATALLLTVDDDREHLAVLDHHETSAMDDPAIVAAVADAVRLTALNERRQAAQRIQLTQLEAARGRLIAATDRQRAATAARLLAEVVRPIEEAAAQLRRIDGIRNRADTREALAVAIRELDASAAEIVALISGLPPATLGNGGLVSALRELAERCPLPVSVRAAPGATADLERETALFYACSEALANTIKHAGASRASIDLWRDRGDLVITIVDDGIGGAQMSGSGLSGLADRLAVFGGRLRVDSPPGAGTELSARIPA
jgi:signal transduction histidine kinase